jgi:hypothetical protein
MWRGNNGGFTMKTNLKNTCLLLTVLVLGGILIVSCDTGLVGLAASTNEGSGNEQSGGQEVTPQTENLQAIPAQSEVLDTVESTNEGSGNEQSGGQEITPQTENLQAIPAQSEVLDTGDGVYLNTSLFKSEQQKWLDLGIKNYSFVVQHSTRYNRGTFKAQYTIKDGKIYSSEWIIFESEAPDPEGTLYFGGDRNDASTLFLYYSAPPPPDKYFDPNGNMNTGRIGFSDITTTFNRIGSDYTAACQAWSDAQKNGKTIGNSFTGASIAYDAIYHYPKKFTIDTCIRGYYFLEWWGVAVSYPDAIFRYEVEITDFTPLVD